MNIKHEDVLIPDTNPFANCKLNRQKYAEALTNILTTYTEGFVLSINNKWGTGKTTFVKMWEKSLMNEGFIVDHKVVATKPGTRTRHRMYCLPKHNRRSIVERADCPPPYVIQA